MSDTVGPRDTDVLARGMNRSRRADLGIEVPELDGIDGYGDRAHLREPELAYRVHDAGIDLEPLGLDDFRPRGDGDVGTDLGDPPVADYQGAFVEWLSRERHDARPADGIDLVR